MDNQLKFLYQQIKDGTICRNDAVNRLKQLKMVPHSEYGSESESESMNKTSSESFHGKHDGVSTGEEGGNKAVEFYTLGAKGKTNDFQDDYLTFCPFPERIPGFSMSRVFLNPETFHVEFELIKDKQIELRQVLFCKEDFNQIHSVFDIGCGHGTDVIQIATLYPHIQTCGFTITQDQAILGNQRIANMNLRAQAKIFHKDSSLNIFPDHYDLIMGIEVSFHIRNKDGLFKNISSSLNDNGRVLLIDFIANLRGPIVDSNVGISIPTVEEWGEILSKHHLAIDEVIDVSPQIANFLYDPKFKQNTENLPQVARDTFQNYTNQSISLQKEWLSYCLFKLRKDTNYSESELCRHNAKKIAKKTPYSEALKEMLYCGHIPYPKTRKSTHNKSLSQDRNSQKNNLKSTSENANIIPLDLTEIKANLVDIFVEVLGFQREEIEEKKLFQELGIGSMNAVEILESINAEFNLKLPTSIVFECNQLDSLAMCIKEHLPKYTGAKKEAISKEVGRSDNEGHFNKKNANSKHRQTSFSEIGNQPLSSSNYHQEITDDIAIIGLSCRCAGANDQNEFWDIVSKGKNCIHEITNDRWLDFLKLNSPHQMPKCYGAMEDIEYFDSLFFHISPKEAESMDVPQRILLEECYKALEDSGYNPSLLREQQVGTIIGAMASTSSLNDLSHFSMLGSETSILSARIAYCLDLKGPALAINTACSSSLVAIDLACQQLRNRQIHLGIAGGITIYTHPGAFISMKNAGMLSPTGQCRPFDNRANGILVGDGVGVVILKRLQDAERDNDFIYGVIRGIGCNQDGRTSGITVPSFLSQSQLEESIYRKTLISVEDIQYIEAHGTATKLGDPVEIHALTRAFGKFTGKKRFCAIGSLKANIGHTTAAAGVLSVIKVLLALKHKQMPPSINFTEENEHIDFENSPVYVNTFLKEWPTNSNGSRLAAISSFGFSGTNAHMLLEEYGRKARVSPKLAIPHDGLILIPLSAKNKERLQAYSGKLLKFLKMTLSEPKDSELNTTELRQEFLQNSVRCLLSSILNIEENEFETEQNLLNYGVEHIHLTQLLEQLQKKFNIEVDVKKFLETNSIASIATYLRENPSKSFETQISGFHKKQNLSQKIEKSHLDNLECFLTSLAYTLQTGREAMEERVVFIVKDLDELIVKLEAFENNSKEIDKCWRGQTKRTRAGVALLEGDEDSQELINKWIKKGKLNKIAELWTQGFAIDWEHLYGELKPYRISLPTYSFAKDRYRIPEIENNTSKIKDASIGICTIHPLLHQNTSDLLEQRFSSTFTGNEFFLTDHQVKGQKILPGVAYIEMARAAVEEAVRPLKKEDDTVLLKYVTWARPIFVNSHPKKVHIGLSAEDDEQILYKIYTKPENTEEEPVVHSQGVALLRVLNEPPALDISSLQTKINQKNISSEECYALFDAAGIDYGQGHRGIENVAIGNNQVLAKLCLPSSVSTTHDQFVLHPSIMDSALQASFGLMIGSDDSMSPGRLNDESSGIPPLKPSLPFALQELQIFNSCKSSMWVWIRYTNENITPDKTQKLDVDLCDDTGKICVRMKGFSTRILHGEIDIGSQVAQSRKELNSHDKPGLIDNYFCVSKNKEIETDSASSPTPCQAFPGTTMVTTVWSPIPWTEFNQNNKETVGTSPSLNFEVNAEIARTSANEYEQKTVSAEVLRDENSIFPDTTAQILIVGGTKAKGRSIQQVYPNARVLEIRSKDSVSIIAEKLKAAGSIDHIVWIAPDHSLKSVTDEAVLYNQNQGVLQVFRMIKALLSLGYGTRGLQWTLLTTQTQAVKKDDSLNPTHASLHGLVGSMAKEYANWKVRLIDLESGSDWPINTLFTIPADPQGNALAYRKGEWYRQKIIPIQQFSVEQQIYKTNGVYIVIGGAGGIGEIWSKSMIQKYQAQIIWIGRRQKDKAIQAKLESLSKFGPTPHYIAADASDKKSLEKAHEEIKQNYSQISGVIHSAIVLLDQSLGNMDEERFNSGLSPKIDISVRIAQIFKDDPLDFVLFFSSMQSILKAAGQSNYAAGCTFKDAFAQRLSQDWTCAVKVINWGYWGTVGVVAAKSYQDRMARDGIGSIEPEEGMAALETLLNGPIDQIGLIKTLKPQTMDRMRSNEWVTVYTEKRSCCIDTLKKQILQDDTQVEFMKSEGRHLDAEMDTLFCKLLWGSLQSLGMFQEKNVVIANLMAKSAIADCYERWLEESIQVLVANHYLRFDGERYTVIETTLVDIDALWKEWDRQKAVFWSRDSDKKAIVALLEVCLQSLPEIITGKRLATEIMFPNSSMELVEKVYKENRVANYFNDVLTQTLIAYIKERLKQDPSAKIRILEVGAGTGGTTVRILSKLQTYQEHIYDYCYTDISKGFLMHAEEKYAPQHSYLTTRIFDVEEPVGGQNIQAGQYDLVIASNVLHATKNIRQTLCNVKAILAKNGLILLNELSNKSLFGHITFGLLEGWWLYEDRPLRIPGCPALNPKTWKEVLGDVGFTSILFPAEKAHELGQQIIVAESDGVILQKQPHLSEIIPMKRSAIAKPDQSFIRAKTPPDCSSRNPYPEGQKIMQGKIDITDQTVEDQVQETIIEKLSESLKVEVGQIDNDESFADYGLDSITGVQLVQTINKSLSIELEITALFDYSSVNRLTAYILSDFKDEIAKTLERESKRIAITQDKTSKNEGEISDHSATTRTNNLNSDEQFLPDNNHKKINQLSSPKRFLERNVSSPVDVEKEDRTSRESVQHISIAIIGMSGRFAKSETLNDFWNHLSSGTDLVTKVSRWDLSKYSSVGSGNNWDDCKYGSFLENIDHFDPVSFKISGLEATYMDPQQRFFLEESWKALEDAGYAGESIQGKLCGIYVGCGGCDYQHLFDDNQPAQAFWGTAESVIPARIAYYLDLHGPAIAVDTACSSSLVAIHLACQGLWARETEMALAGGVFIQSTPGFYVSAGRAGMLSPNGRCHTFDERANGFVPGEGVGVIVLKRLHDAISGGDHIYGVIRGSGINQDGTTNGITAPSAKSQERLERQVYDRFNINPEQIQMVEAHGTGTKLGDPIEFEALTRSFRNYTDKQEYCALGSVKTNIGHAATAAGVAGVIKVLLSLQHKKIPPSIHYESGNSRIQFKNSPFYVNTELQDWHTEKNSTRSAAISSFGFSGTNAHLVIEEAPKLEPRYAEKSGYLIVLSAETSDQLHRHVENILKFSNQKSTIDPGNMSYTLLVGRKHLNYRLACVVRSLNELSEFLKKWLEKETVSQIYVSELKEQRQRQQASLKRYGNHCIQECRKLKKTAEYLEHLNTIADLYIQGYRLEYEQLFVDGYSRISLPTYPFAKERYWVESTAILNGHQAENCSKLHPLLHQNISDLSEQKFSSIFTGKEFFLTDHLVQDQKVLPGVAYLEMAQAAIMRATGSLGRNHMGIRLENIVWVQPIMVNSHPQEIHIRLFPQDNDQISFEIYSYPEKEGQEPVIHCQGTAMLSSINGNTALDLPNLQSECKEPGFDPEYYYEIFSSMGIHYGPGHRGLKTIMIGEKQVLAKLTLPSEIVQTRDQFVLHPCLMDSALQASIGLITLNPAAISPESMIDEKRHNLSMRPSLPFALQELEIFGACTSSMWAWIRYSQGSNADDSVVKLDFDLCDDTGRICVKMKGFSTRTLEDQTKIDCSSQTTSIESSLGNILLTTLWNSVQINTTTISPPSTAQMVIIGGAQSKKRLIRKIFTNVKILDISSKDSIVRLSTKLKALGSFNHIVWIAPDYSLKTLTEEALIIRQNQGVLYVFRLIKALLAIGYDTTDLEWTLITTQTQRVCKNDLVIPTDASIHGLAGSLAKEYPHWKIRLIDMEVGCSWPISDMFALPSDDHGNAWSYRAGQWYKQDLVPVQQLWKEQQLYKSNGIYVVIGGAGGIGEAWSQSVIQQYQAQLIWIGRRQINAAIQMKLDSLSTIGPTPIYIAADAGNQKSLQQAYKEIKKRFSKIDGVIHSAIVLKDKSLANMDEQQFRSVLSAKVDVCVRLAQIFQKEDLDFVLFFSSIQSFSKAAGQSNYASGSTFKDAFAQRLSREWSCIVKVMNWGYWGSVGIATDQSYQDRMERFGIGSIEPEEGMKALESLLNGSLDQIAMIKVLRPQALHGINLKEFITTYRDTLTPTIQTIQEYLPKRSTEIQRIKSAYDQQNAGIESLIHNLLWGSLLSLGGFQEKKSPIASVKEKAGIINFYERWLEESISVLTSKNYIQVDDENYTVVNTTIPVIDVLWGEWEQQSKLLKLDADKKAMVNLVEATLRNLPEILTGKQRATDILFPNSSMELVEGIYKKNQTADFFNSVVAQSLVAYIQARLKQDSSAEIRILEIGAGTGGTTATVLSALRPYKEHIFNYSYTDISKAFLIHAEKKYAPQNPYLTTQIFDVEQPIAQQKIKANHYDIVIATNVLHATSNIRQTLRNSKAVLRKHGLIILNELSTKSLFAHLTFGLLEGWWLYEDAALRISGSPGLYPDTWKNVLEAEGFHSAFFPVAEAHDLGQQIIIAQSDGVIRQTRPVNGRSNTGSTRAPNTPLQNHPKQSTPNGRYTGMLCSKSVGVTVAANQTESAPKSCSSTQRSLREKCTIYIKKLIAETLKIPIHQIDISKPLETYGIDSILAVQLTNSLRENFEKISNTIFFEVQTIDALIEYIIETEKDALIKVVGTGESEIKSELTTDRPISMLSPTEESTSKTRTSSRFLPPRVTDKNFRACNVSDIAIISVSGRYPGADNIHIFWDNLRDGKDCITEIPQDRWDNDLYFDQNRNKLGKSYCKWGGFLDGIDQFDPLFFNISPREAKMIDPQERLFLETTWNLLEGVGYTRDNLQARYQGRVGVYVGAMYQQYHLLGPDHNDSITPVSSYSSIANRVSYFFNFQGPSIALDTMCSSSAIAIHMACESLAQGDCKLAIAGGVNLSIHPQKYVLLSQSQVIGSHRNSRSFANGDGIIPSEGVGAVLLKPLDQAMQDQNTILGVIKSTITNHGGKTNGFSVPNPNAQVQLVKDNFTKSKIDPRTISYVESAANGSAIGDPIEINALTKAFRKFTPDQHFCAIGSVKSNIGHAEAASGISQLTKVILQLQHRQLVPSIKSTSLNPNLNFTETPFYLQREPQTWKRPIVKIDGVEREIPRRATISSFGAGGTNAHLIIEEYLEGAEDEGREARELSQKPVAIVLSAKNEDRLKEITKNLLDFITHQILNHKSDTLNLSDLAYTLQVGREAMEFRVAMLVSNQEELVQGLKAYWMSSRQDTDQEFSIPIFTGNQEESHSDIGHLLSGKSGETVLQVLLAENNLEKLALCWAQGGKIPWESLHNGQGVRRICLPTYPFKKRRCWIESQVVSNTFSEKPGATDQVTNLEKTPPDSINNQVIDIISNLLGMKGTEVNVNKPLDQYGVDSILSVQLLQQLQTRLDPSLDIVKLQECKTLQDIIHILPPQNSEKLALLRQKSSQSLAITWSQFPELIHLNQIFSGRPVFWIHGAIGGVELYQRIAQNCQRPLYGIQSRGWMADRSPLPGIYAMAAYYVHIIQTVQPEGPYDLGGYSLGGMLAYEVTRQLQELGQTVNTIVMLDSLDSATTKKANRSPKANLLQTVNMALQSTILKEPEKITKTLIHRAEVNSDIDNETYLDQLIALAKTRGLTKTESWVRTLIRQNVTTQDAYQADHYAVLPLPAPDTTTCYYFRNKSGLLMGKLEPFFTIKANEFSLDHTKYWEEWEQHLPLFHIMDVDSPNHMMLLSEPKAYETITTFCDTLYSGKGLSEEFLNSFKRKTKTIHASLT